MWQVVIHGPGYFDSSFDLPEGETTLGRADENEIVLSGDLVSRRHARFVVRGTTFTVEDLGSRNGCKLNNKPFTGMVSVSPGDVIGVGENTLLVRRAADTATFQTPSGGTAASIRRISKEQDVLRSLVMSRSYEDSVIRRMLSQTQPGNDSNSSISTEGENALTRPGSRLSNEGPPVADEADEHDTQDYSAALSPFVFQSLALMYRVAERLSTATALQDFLDDALDALIERIGANTGVILVKGASGALQATAVRYQAALQRGEIPVSDTVLEMAMEQGKAICVAANRDDQLATKDSVRLYRVEQAICIPLGSQLARTGVVYLNRPTTSTEALEEVLDVCSAVAQLIHSGIQKFQSQIGRDERLRRALERFYSPEVVTRRVAELLLQDNDFNRLEPIANATVLVADIADFGAYMSKTPPETVVEVLHAFYAIATKIIYSFEGTVDKFLGDSVMAIFGTPYSRPDDAMRALRTAMVLRSEWNRYMLRRPQPERLTIRAALSSGPLLAGTIGSAARLDYAALGEAVNVSSWMCSTANAGQILLTGKTLASLNARFDVNPLGERTLFDGKVKTSVFEALDEDLDTGTLSGARKLAE